jgi:hypothetical protein
VNNVEDLAGNSIGSSNTAQYLFDPDLTPPLVNQVSILDAVTLNVTFSEQVTEETALNLSNYSINNGINVNGASINSSSNTVTLTTSVHTNGNYNLTVEDLADLSGNIMTPSIHEYNFAGDLTPPELINVSVINFNTIDINFSEAVEPSSAMNISNYTLNNGASVNVAVLSFDGTSVILTTSNLSVGTSYLLTVDDVTDLSGNVIGSNNSSTFITPDPSSNLVKNTNFEGGNLDDWDSNNTLGGAAYTFGLNSTSAINGSYDARLEVTSAGTNDTRPILIGYLSDSTKLGFAYQFSFKTKVISGNPVISYIYFDGVKFVDLNLEGEQEWTFEVSAVENPRDYIGFYTDGTQVSAFSIDDIEVKMIFFEIDLNVKILLEGPYNGTTMDTNLNFQNLIPSSQPFNVSPWNYAGTETISELNSDVVDWILIELRSTPSHSQVVMRKPALLKKDGTIVDLDGSSKPTFYGLFEGDYYVVLMHRNHLPVMSKTRVTLTSNSSLYDFTQPGKAFGFNPMNELNPGVFGMISGDGNSSYDVTASDFCIIWNDQNGTSGYLSGDFDLNGVVTDADKLLHWLANNGRVSQIPHN